MHNLVLTLRTRGRHGRRGHSTRLVRLEGFLDQTVGVTGSNDRNLGLQKESFSTLQMHIGSDPASDGRRSSAHESKAGPPAAL